MNREHLHPKIARGFNSVRHCVGDVVELEIEPDPRAGGQNSAHNFGAFGRVKLEPDFEKRDIAPEPLDELERPLLCGDVQRYDDFVTKICHSERSRGIPRR
jgi:hypothetical protein